MKKFEVAELTEIMIADTAYGPFNKEIPDSELTQVIIDGEPGWAKDYGEKEYEGQ